VVGQTPFVIDYVDTFILGKNVDKNSKN